MQSIPLPRHPPPPRINYSSHISHHKSNRDVYGAHSPDAIAEAEVSAQGADYEGCGDGVDVGVEEAAFEAGEVSGGLGWGGVGKGWVVGSGGVC